ncbi:DNA repair protein rad5a [Dionaea muscipula]
MSKKVTDEQVATVRSVIGEEYNDMDIIRALHMSNNDVTGAINIIFDTPSFRCRNDKHPIHENHTKVERSLNQEFPLPSSNSTGLSEKNYECEGAGGLGSGISRVRGGLWESVSESSYSGPMDSDWWLVGRCEVSGLSTCKGRRIKTGEEVVFKFPVKNDKPTGPSPGKSFGRGRQAAACSEIVRFSMKDNWEIGRIPNEWARCLLPLVRDKKVRVEGFCQSAPDILGIMDTVVLSVSVYINSTMFRKHHQTSLKSANKSTEESVVHPLPTLFRLLGLSPFKKAELTPDDLYSKKRPLNSKVEFSGLHASLLKKDNNSKDSSPNGNKVESEEAVSDADIDKIVGVGESSELEELDPPSTLLCELRPYQKQALHWMVNLEQRDCMDEAATTLHPCWEAYHLADKRNFVVYLNAFSGEATIAFPSSLQMARGGILADAMGLGKTIMTISLLLTNSERTESPGSLFINESSGESPEVSEVVDVSPGHRKARIFPGFDKLMKQRSLIYGGNLIVCPMTLLGQWKAEIETHAQPSSLSLYVHYGQSRPKDSKILAHSDVVLTTYGVLASEFSAENTEDCGSLYSIRWFRVVLDEAHTIKSPKSQISMAAASLTADRRWCLTGTPIQNNLDDIYSLLRFLRVEPWGNWAWWSKLIKKPFEEGDERGLKLVQSVLKPIMLRRTKLSVDREGRPILVLPPANIQVLYCELTEAEKDFYEALFKRSKVKFDQFVEQGRVLHNYASILELLLRLRQCCDHPFLVMRVKGDSFSREHVGEHDGEHERREIDAFWVYLFDSRVAGLMCSSFAMFWSLKCVRSTYQTAYIHQDILVPLDRGDTQEFSDLNKLAKRFLGGGRGSGEMEAKALPSRAYIQEVVDELQKGEQGECPICLEAFEDAVLTPCAHRLCRECLLASWRNQASGLCPVCRKTVSRQDLITAPTNSRFQVDIEKNWVESTKVSALLRELEDLRSSRSKSIIFSQWTAFLDILQIPLTRSNIPFARLDGTLNQQQREKVIKQFSEESDVLVLLMSLKAGGVGINLTAASNAFVLDPWWNPAVEEQAVMRIHRIGQTKTVMIKRFIVKGTVEERMEAVQARKQRMISGALTDQEVRTARIEELKMLFT